MALRMFMIILYLFYDQEQRNEISSESSHISKLIENKDENGKIILGVFGFISEYKGISTVISALKLLPTKYNLVIFGGLHPNSIKKGDFINSYLEKLIDELSPKNYL